MNKIHLYQMRHVFLDDDHIGKYDVQTRSIRLRAEAAEHKDRVKAHFMRAHGIVASVAAGDEEFARAAPLKEFPEEILALMTPQLGDKTPAVIAYAREHFSKEEFARRYPAIAREVEPVEVAEPAPAPAPTKKQGKKSTPQVKPEPETV